MDTMDSFLKKYSFTGLRNVFIANDITDDVFYALSNDKIVDILKDKTDSMIEFISKYNFEKGLMLQNCETDFLLNCDSVHDDLLLVGKTSNTEISESSLTTVTESFMYVENELFHFLNAADNLQGKIILGRYRKSKELDYARLKELVIVHELREENSYKIEPTRFIELRRQIVKLFPTEDGELFYIPYYRGVKNERISPQGGLYSTYKFFRKLLREAGVVFEDTIEKEKTDSPKETLEDKEQLTKCLSDPDREKYSTADILSAWEKSRPLRSALLNPKKKSDVIPLSTYLNSFPCLKFPLGISLLEKDFDSEILRLIKAGTLDDKPKIPYSSLLSKTWPEWVPKIIQFAKKSRIKEVKEFVARNKDLIDKGTHNNIVALIFLPLCMTVPKVYKINKTESVTLTKEEISKSFILHVEVNSHLQTEKNKFEDWMRTNQQPLHPYLILCGPIEDISQILVVLNSEIYAYSDAIKACEACYKCLVALNSWSYTCDYVWYFFQKLIFKIAPEKSYATVSKLIVDLCKLK